MSLFKNTGGRICPVYFSRVRPQASADSHSFGKQAPVTRLYADVTRTRTSQIDLLAETLSVSFLLLVPERLWRDEDVVRAPQVLAERSVW